MSSTIQTFSAFDLKSGTFQTVTSDVVKLQDYQALACFLRKMLPFLSTNRRLQYNFGEEVVDPKRILSGKLL